MDWRRALGAIERRARDAARWLWDFVICLDKARTPGLAAETAFWLFTSLLPLAAVAGLVAAHLSVANWSDVTPLLSSLPLETRTFLQEELVKVSAWNEGTVGITGTLVFIWLASSGVHSIYDGLELQMGGARPWWKKRLLAIVSCVGLSIGVATTAIIGPGIEALVDELGALVPLDPALLAAPLGRTVRFGMSALVMWGYVAALYWVGIPRERLQGRRHMPLLPGATLAAGLQLVFALGYGLYLSKMGTGSTYMAGLAVVGATMIGLYLFSFALLTGVVLNHKLWSSDCPVAANHAADVTTGRARPAPARAPAPRARP